LKDYFSNILNTENLSSSELRESYTKLMNINIHRRLIKKSIMTIPYNASAYSIVNYFKAEFNMKKEDGKIVYYYKDDPNIIFYEIDFQSLSKALSVVIFKDYPKLAELLNYLKEIAHIYNKLQIQIPWKLPTGLLVKQQYYKTKTLKVKPFLYSKDLLNLKIIEKEKFNNRKQIRAFMPNLIHSLDAASLVLLINEFFKENKEFNFYSIHDCFAVTCNNVELIMNFLKSAYCIIYSKENYLLELNKTLLKNILDNYGENCYDPQTKIITIERSDKKIKLKFPDITKIIDSEENSLEFLKSSYILH
jgi:DNA-directed RNA polymerase